MSRRHDLGIGGTSGGSSSNPLPAVGKNRAFDDYVQHVFGDVQDQANIDDLRAAAWATWKTGPPSGKNRPSGSTDRAAAEDEELARALALSAEDHKRDGDRSVVDLTADSDEEDLRKVIAMSEEEARAPKRQRREETPEEERRLIEEAIAASMSANGNRERSETLDEEDEADDIVDIPNPAAASSTAENPDSTPGPTAGSSRASQPPTNSLLGDRAQMEKERLARQAARQAGSSQQSSQPRSNGTKPSIDKPKDFKEPPVASSSRAYVPARLRTVADLSASPSPTPPPTAGSSNVGPANPFHPFQSPSPLPQDAAGVYYPDGEMRHTALTIGKATTERTFSPQDLIGDKSQVSLIIMSSFVIDDEWLETFMPPAEAVPRIMIRPQPKEVFWDWNGKVQAQMNGEVRCYPKMRAEFGSAHMKFAWIFYKTGRLRVAIFTANMVPYDWEWIENTVFIQDILPRQGRSVSESSSSQPPSHDFPSRFRWLFVHLKVHKALKFLIEKHHHGSAIPLKPSVTEGFENIDQYDWSRVRVKLVMSVPDKYEGSDKMDDFGICRLGKILNQEGWKPQAGEAVHAEFQGSSLGTYDMSWFDLFYQYCSGKSTANLLGRGKALEWPKKIKILFPSLVTVDNSILGRDGGGTMFCGKAMNSITRPFFHDANSKRGGVLMHAKVLIATFQPQSDPLGLASSAASTSNGKRKASDMEGDASNCGGWVYIGSHNFSPSAWGRPTFGKNSSNPSLSISNYELGFVFPLPRENTQKVADAIAPYVRPSRKYSETDMPWDQKLHNEA